MKSGMRTVFLKWSMIGTTGQKGEDDDKQGSNRIPQEYD